MMVSPRKWQHSLGHSSSGVKRNGPPLPLLRWAPKSSRAAVQRTRQNGLRGALERPQGGASGAGGTGGTGKKLRGKLWDKRHDMKVIAKPAPKKPGKAKAVDLF